ncbi:cellobiohydrolase from Melanocarpus Albomyces complexed with Cellotetraose [Immersiella caudata]|uniref:Glucanase n=1 Tax=Immersiella caudata TaxID=314043 RepID=A0AA39XE83_9PEZI|nr:cellobiohydrolase from Melanocarpus Albomyces complexed with Cellotetraose [Immersiella caudata]
MLLLALIPLFALPSPSTSQQIGTYNRESHPSLSWTHCAAANTCSPVNGSLTVDQRKRWLHPVDNYSDCHWFGSYDWNPRFCNTTEVCTDICALDGADYRPNNGLGASFANTSVTLAAHTWKDFQTNVGLRFFLLDSSSESESPKLYQTFTLLGNEFTFTVNFTATGCGINSGLTFVEMDADGGMAKYPTNKAGAEYGTGHCDSKCSRTHLFVGGKANLENWTPSEVDPALGEGRYGACCPEFSVWNSNRRSYSFGSHLCSGNGYTICEGEEGCAVSDGADVAKTRCDAVGCGYNPYQMGDRDFYGEGKKVDTMRPFTVVTRFEAERVYQIFVQDGKRIDTPPPSWDGLPKEGGISKEMCSKSAEVFGEPDRFGAKGGWDAHVDMLKRPMVLALSINPDVSPFPPWYTEDADICSQFETGNSWLDSVHPKGADTSKPGVARGDCPTDGPWEVFAAYRNAKVTWSNLRFGPIGSTIDL